MVTILGALLIYSRIDFMQLTTTFWGPGWDFMTNCDAARAYSRGLNPYALESYQFSRIYFTYQPAWLPVTAGLCHLTGTNDLHHVHVYWPLYWMLAACAVGIAARMHSTGQMAWLFGVTSLAGLGGFLWIARSGNVSEFEMIFLVIALAFLLRGFSHSRRAYDELAFAVAFGLFAAVKTISIEFIPLFVLLPWPMPRKIALAAIAAALGMLPVIVSLVIGPQYEHLIVAHLLNDRCSPSFLCLAKDFAHQHDIPRQAIIRVVLAGLVAVTILAFCFNRRLTQDLRRRMAAFRSLPPHMRLRVFLAQLASPRLKEYTYALLAVIAATYLASRGRVDRQALVITGLSLLPVLLDHPRLASYSVGGMYIQLYAATVMLAVMVVGSLHCSYRRSP
jgi:hypothetical protein